MRPFGRLGLDLLVDDHRRTLVEYDEEGNAHASLSDYVLFFGVPIAAGVVVGVLDLHLRVIDPLLTGVSILTGLLFGLLIHVLSLGLSIAHDSRIHVTHPVVRLADQLRANIAWACGVGLSLVAVLTIAGSFLDVSKGLPALLTAIVCALALHLGGTLLMIMKRVRATYRMLGK